MGLVVPIGDSTVIDTDRKRITQVGGRIPSLAKELAFALRSLKSA